MTRLRQPLDKAEAAHAAALAEHQAAVAAHEAAVEAERPYLAT